MKITPLDLTAKEFSLSFRGYKRAEVDDFLNNLAEELQELIRENSTLKEENANLQRRLEEYKRIEDNLRNSLLLAEKVAEELKANSHKEAEVIRAKAELEATRIVEEAQRAAQEARITLQKFHAQLRSLLKVYSELESAAEKCEVDDREALQGPINEEERSFSS